LQDVLLEGVVGTALRWDAEEIAPPGIGGEGFAVPLLDRVRRISQHNIKLLKAIAFDKLWLR
jgi:hypothetical protein